MKNKGWIEKFYYMHDKIESRNIGIAFVFSLFSLGFLFFQSKGIEGGLDSWNHFLISRSAIKYPELLLDQWNKPIFTWLTVFVCQFGMNALVWFNIICVLFSGLLIALAFKKQKFSHAWVLLPLLVFTPILFENIISGLTEPLNVLMLSTVMYFWANNKLKTALIIASFLPFVRTEGFVILGAIILMVLYKKQYKALLWLFVGSFVMNFVGFLITGKPFWIITENPYWQQEVSGKFDPGSGSFFHFFKVARNMFGLLGCGLFLFGNLVLGYLLVKKQKIDDLFLLSFLVFWAYFMAHTTIYYLGILGSHGLLRVMAVVVPAFAIIIFYGLNTAFKSLKFKNAGYFYLLLILGFIHNAYKETEYAKPYRWSKATIKVDKGLQNFYKAGEWLKENNLLDSTIIHQSPYFNVAFNKDPYNEKSSFYVWSINQEKDYAPKGIILVWDGFSAVREGNMKLIWLRNNPEYEEIHYIEGFEKPKENPQMWDIRIFRKISYFNK